ncbi:type III pantothenate kinase [Labilibacter marinus]|uniref:type III pantothenate kinase n=1 Tax=Labilibacter marinus TaxID=1477105 RepID=UPI00094F7A3D|nr:type III pantothenate kinase [Labilibacter marinus]
MNLVIDEGNTFTKIGVFDKGDLIHSDSSKNPDKSLFSKLQQSFSIDQLIISSVKTDYTKVNDVLDKFNISNINTSHILNASSFLPIKNNYKTPHTMGKDRIAALVGGFKLYPSTPLLIIDSGTAITVDYLNENGTFLGGNISPGLQTRFNALHQNTEKLPLLNQHDHSPFMGLCTDEAIWSGVQNGILFEVEGYINHFNELNNSTKTILTGGDAYFFAKNLKNPIFVHLNLVLTGLNTILEYNAKNK